MELAHNRAVARNEPLVIADNDYRTRYPHRDRYRHKPYQAFVRKVLAEGKQREKDVQRFLEYLRKSSPEHCQTIQPYSVWRHHSHDDCPNTFGAAVIGIEFPPDQLQDVCALLVDFEVQRTQSKQIPVNSAQEFRS